MCNNSKLFSNAQAWYWDIGIKLIIKFFFKDNQYVLCKNQDCQESENLNVFQRNYEMNHTNRSIGLMINNVLILHLFRLNEHKIKGTYPFDSYVIYLRFNTCVLIRELCTQSRAIRSPKIPPATKIFLQKKVLYIFLEIGYLLWMSVFSSFRENF